MRRKQWGRMPDAVEELRGRLERWRQGRQKRSPMPESLWESAAALAAAHGIHRVARVLGLNYAALKRRSEALGVSGPGAKIFPAPVEESSAAAAEAVTPPAFVRLEWPACLAGAPCVVELENRAGLKMRISLREPSGAELGALVAAFGRPAP